MDIARMIREDLLYQNAYTLTNSVIRIPPSEKFLMLAAIIRFYDKANELLQSNVELSAILPFLHFQTLPRCVLSKRRILGFDRLEAKMMHELGILSEGSKIST